MEQIDGYEIPLHRSLTEQILLAGVPRSLAYLNGTFAVAFGGILKSWYVLPICLIIHVVAIIMTKKDPQFFDCFVRHIKQKNYFSTPI
jgi:type IV secretory pathway TrbD component